MNEKGLTEIENKTDKKQVVSAYNDEIFSARMKLNNFEIRFAMSTMNEDNTTTI